MRIGHSHSCEATADLAAFAKQLPALLERFEGKFALMVYGSVAAIYPTRDLADAAGLRIRPDGAYLVRQILPLGPPPWRRVPAAQHRMASRPG